MTPEHWAKIEEIFQAALDCPPALRASFIRKQCGNDAQLLSDVENLINGYDTNNPFLESPVWDDSQLFQLTLKQNIASAVEEIAGAEKGESLNGQIIGVYRLEKEIGR